MFIDSTNLIDVQVYVSEEGGSIGLVDLNLLTPVQRKVVEKCYRLPISELPQDLRTAILSQAIQSGKLKMSITTDLPENLRQVSQPETNIFSLGD